MYMILAIASGGAIGGVLRYFTYVLMDNLIDNAFPWGTLTVNVLGSFLLGICAILFSSIEDLNQTLRVFLMFGVLSAFTTFSTFSLDAFKLWEREEYLLMASYIGGSVFCSIAGLFAGVFLMRQILA